MLTGSDSSTVTETLARRTSPTNPALMNLTKTFTYDALDRVTLVEDAIGNRVETVYDANGQVYQVIGHYKQPNGTYVDRTVSTRAYDAADRMIQDTDVYGKTTTHADTQLYYYRARYYDPSVGRFISEDPKGFGAGVNFYAYVGNNPVNGNDPSGMDYRIVGTPSDQALLQSGISALRGTEAGSQILKAISDPQYNLRLQVSSAYPTEFFPDYAQYPGKVSATIFVNPQQLATSYSTFRADDTASVVMRQLSVPEALAHEFGHALNPPSAGSPPSLAYEQSIMKGYENPVSFELSGLRRDSYMSTTNPNENGGPVWNAAGGAAETKSLDSNFGKTQPPPIQFELMGDSSADESAAAGGFLLYPNKPNNNQAINVYRKP